MTFEQKFWFVYLTNGLAKANPSRIFCLYHESISHAIDLSYHESKAYIRTALDKGDHDRLLNNFRVALYRQKQQQVNITLPVQVYNRFIALQEALEFDCLSDTLEFLLSMDDKDFKRYKKQK
ncbi:hypothetical protein [Gayadomonas joobiniege]|uniref:hypothetical protein n=1 Tax=Gayadomonas joobiniege TaxID=1234606 RepID=UPI0003768CE1|nr:hypothetical protein [Gayadomonas joobiniege]